MHGIYTVVVMRMVRQAADTLVECGAALGTEDEQVRVACVEAVAALDAVLAALHKMGKPAV